MIEKLLREKIDNWSSCKISELYSKVESVNCVSFDIFDTLIKRDVPKPTDVFELIELRYRIPQFKEKRIAAEKRARKISLNREVTHKEIYQCYDGENTEKLADLEIEVEKNICVPNLTMIDFYKYCVKNKRVFLISDMYLPDDVMESILNKNGINGYEALYISCELGTTKLEGDLYKYICDLNHIEPGELLHIGNSFKADYQVPSRLGIKAVKVATYEERRSRNYSTLLCTSPFPKKCLDAFTNNHVPLESDEYLKFGFEVFGPLLYGFIFWLQEDMVKNGIEQVLFLARDGYIMQKAYRLLGFDKTIPDYYFEASRRSLRVPTYRALMNYLDFLNELTVPNKTNMIQIFDSWGLDAFKYKELIESCGIELDEQLKRDLLKENEAVHKIFNKVKKDIVDNAADEDNLLRKYLAQYDFSKKTAIVDIGWGGSMQKYLTKTLKSLGLKTNISGYYVGLTAKAKINLGNNDLKAKGYAFDALNTCDNDMERPFVGLFETLFLEQWGSIKRYTDIDGKIKSIRYPYEYSRNGKLTREAIDIGKVQEGALRFIEIIKTSEISFCLEMDSKIAFSNLYQTGTNPTLDNIKTFGGFSFFNNGSKVLLACPKSIFYYVKNPKRLIKDLYESQWKIGFLKALLKLPLPYIVIFNGLRKASN